MDSEPATLLRGARRDPESGALTFDFGLPWSPVALVVYVAAVLVTLVFGLLHGAALLTGNGGAGADVVIVILGVAGTTSVSFFVGGLLWRRRGGHLTVRLRPGSSPRRPGRSESRRGEGAYRSPEASPRFEVRWRGRPVDEGVLTEERLVIERFDVPVGRLGLRSAPRFALVLRSEPVAEPWRWRVGVERRGYDLVVGPNQRAIVAAARRLAEQLGLDPARIDEGQEP